MNVSTILFYLVIFAACIAAGGGITKSKGRGFQEGALLGGILGLLGVIIALCLKQRHPPGMVRLTCPRCSMSQNVASEPDSYACWQCNLVSWTPAGLHRHKNIQAA